MIEKARKTLTELGQTEFLTYFDGLTLPEQETLAAQIASLDFSVLDADRVQAVRGKFEPMQAVTLAEIAAKQDAFTARGLEALRAGKVGCVLLAGGQGSRLGYDKPKGMFNIGVNRELFIFECLIRNLSSVAEQAGVPVPLFVMTSEDNHDETKAFFEAHDYFGYTREVVIFFSQEQLPTVDEDGRLMLSENGLVLTAPNGNGGWFASMARAGILDIVKEKGIEWLNVFAVDNVLQKCADPCFIGAVLESGMTSGAKVVAKADAEEKVGVLCLEDGRPSIAEYYEMTEEMRTRREPDGTLSYNYGVILNYLFRVDKLTETLGVTLPLHRAHKALKCMTPEGQIVNPEKPNGYKFETLALDMVRLQDDCLAFETDRIREFAPVKNKTGVDSVDTARALLQMNGVTL